MIGGACNFCATKRLGAAETVERLGVALVGPDGGHHTVADLVMDGYEVFSF